MFKAAILSVVLFFASVSLVNAQVVINEFVSNPNSGNDWVELYSDSDIDIGGWILDDEGTSTNMATIPVNTLIGPSSNKFYVVEVGTRLNQSEDKVYLYKQDQTLIDSKDYNYNPGTDVSFGRYPDGQSWGTCVLSKGLTNSDCTFPTSTPSPTSSSTPTSTPATSTPSPTKTPTLSPTKSPTPKPTAKASKSPEGTPSDFESEVLSAREELLASDSPSPTPSPKKFSFQNIFPVVLILFGIGLLGIGGYPFIKAQIKKYNERNEKLS